MSPSSLSGDEKSVESSVGHTPVLPLWTTGNIGGKRPNPKARKP
jgi:hypothetical protein